MQRLGKRWAAVGDWLATRKRRSRLLDERQAELATFRLLLTSMRKRYTWDLIKCAIATGIPAFWILVIVGGQYFPAALTASVPPWLAVPLHPLLEEVPALWMIAISLSIAAFQWYNLAHYQRRVIPLIHDMYERALARRDPDVLAMLGEALRLSRLRESFRSFARKLVSVFR